ncbi:MAG: multicomponent Na+:H+ antiporter subunit MnhC [Oceanicaulis sp. HLUCCA04]|nr:MAG: multicomponent Na+:H+ antiporter subunit MnhC [Oceanicaulis sp. HLUCCA04]
MTLLYAIAVAAVMAAGVFLMFDRNVIRIVLGTALIATGVNLIIFLAGRLGPTDPAIIGAGSYTLQDGAANPLPQALVLTAIVIGFALLALATIVAYEATRHLGTVNADDMNAARDDGDPFGPESGEGSSASR